MIYLGACIVYMIFSFFFGMLIGRMIKFGNGDDE